MDAWRPLIASVASLMSRMTTRDAEVAATVHFTARELERELGEPPRERQVHEAVMHWKARKQPPLSENEVAAQIRNLAMLHWLNVRPSPTLPLEDPAEAMF